MNNSTPSSSSSLTYKWSYDVFISFRGPDVRKRFIGYLYQKLCEIKQVKTFMDDRTIEPGEQIDETLIKAIQESRIGLVVFSANYASSSFCLDELAKIIECSIDQKSMLFLPVFYEIEPSVLRHQKGSYKEALTKHEARFGKEKIQVWKRALNKAAGVSGFSSDNYKYESYLISDITQSITKKISKLREGDKSQMIYNITQQDRVNPKNAPLVVGQLFNEEFPEDFIEGSLLPDELVEECKKSHSLPLFTQSLEHLVSEGNQDVHVHNALAKIMIYSNNNPEHFLTTNPYYDSRLVGKYCEKRDPTLAIIAYQKGKCDDELVNVTNKNSLLKLQARYVVERMDDDLWEKVLNPKNEFRRQLIDQVVSTVRPESKSPSQILIAVKAFVMMGRPHELIELVEKIVLGNAVFSGDSNLENLLIFCAFKVDSSRVMNYIKRLDNFDGPAAGKVAVEAQLYEEAFAIFKKFNLNVHAVSVLLDNLRTIDRAVEFASLVKDEVWTQVANAQLRESSLIK